MWPGDVSGHTETDEEGQERLNTGVQGLLGISSQEVDSSDNLNADPIPNIKDFAIDPLLYQILHLQSVLENEAEDQFEERSPSNVRSSVSGISEVTFEFNIPGVILNSEESRCYDAFVGMFLPTIAPGHCDPQFQPRKMLLRYAAISETVREIFLACGAAQIAYNEDEFISKSYQRYVKCVNLLLSDIKNSTEGCEDHLFICVQLLQTLCLRDKSLGLNATKSAGHIAAAYEIIKKRFIKNVTASISHSFRLSSLDRILTEHFIFNFPITLILCRHDKLSKVPSPFQFFEQFCSMLSRSTFSDPREEWKDHPILGVSLRAHEICAKTTWLFRTKTLPLTPEDTLRAFNLREQTNAELDRLCALIELESLTALQKESIAYARSKLYAASITLVKLMNPAVVIDDESVQMNVDLLVSELKYVRELNNDHLFSIWALLIGGSAAIRKKHRDVIQDGFEQISRLIRSSLAQKVMRYLSIVWEEDQNVGLMFLFDTKVLDMICT